MPSMGIDYRGFRGRAGMSDLRDFRGETGMSLGGLEPPNYSE